MARVKKDNLNKTHIIIAYGKGVESKIEKQRNTGVIIQKAEEVFGEGC